MNQLRNLGHFKRALIDACAAVHFVPAFEFSKARTRGITACLNLGTSEAQGKLGWISDVLTEWPRCGDFQCLVVSEKYELYPYCRQEPISDQYFLGRKTC